MLVLLSLVEVKTVRGCELRPTLTVLAQLKRAAADLNLKT